MLHFYKPIWLRSWYLKSYSLGFCCFAYPKFFLVDFFFFKIGVLAMPFRLVLNSQAQVIFLFQPPKYLWLQVSTTEPGSSKGVFLSPLSSLLSPHHHLTSVCLFVCSVLRFETPVSVRNVLGFKLSTLPYCRQFPVQVTLSKQGLFSKPLHLIEENHTKRLKECRLARQLLWTTSTQPNCNQHLNQSNWN